MISFKMLFVFLTYSQSNVLNFISGGIIYVRLTLQVERSASDG